MTDDRIRGRKGVELRRRRLMREPLCRHCREKGRVRASTVPDHIVPLAYGGTDTDNNVQCLCDECHEIKSSYEDTAHGGAANHPGWLKQSAIPLTIVCGPPCSGKTTYVHERVHHDDVVIDIDAIAQSIDPSYQHWEGKLHGDLLNKCIRVRNNLLGSLSRKRYGNAWFIVSAPTSEERQWWSDKLGGVIVLLNPGRVECKRRALERGTPRAIAGVDDWERRSVLTWERRRDKSDTGVDANGRPISKDHPWNKS